MSNIIDKQELIPYIKCSTVKQAIEDHSGDLTTVDLINIYQKIDGKVFEIIDYNAKNPSPKELLPFRKQFMDKVLLELQLIIQNDSSGLDLQSKEVRKDIFSKSHALLTQEEKIYKFYWCLKNKIAYDQIPTNEIKLKNPNFETTIKDFWKSLYEPYKAASTEQNP